MGEWRVTRRIIRVVVSYVKNCCPRFALSMFIIRWVYDHLLKGATAKVSVISNLRPPAFLNLAMHCTFARRQGSECVSESVFAPKINRSEFGTNAKPSASDIWVPCLWDERLYRTLSGSTRCSTFLVCEATNTGSIRLCALPCTDFVPSANVKMLSWPGVVLSNNCAIW